MSNKIILPIIQFFSKIIVFDDLNGWMENSFHFHTIFCLNLIDRHPRPISLLQDLFRKIQHDNGYLVLALVLPISQYVEYPEKSIDGNFAQETLPVVGRTFEQQVESFYEKVIDKKFQEK